MTHPCSSKDNSLISGFKNCLKNGFLPTEIPI